MTYSLNTRFKLFRSPNLASFTVHNRWCSDKEPLPLLLNQFPTPSIGFLIRKKNQSTNQKIKTQTNKKTWMQSYFSHHFLGQPSLHLRTSPQVNFMGLLEKRRVLMTPNLQSGITITVWFCNFTKKLRSPRSGIIELCWSKTAISMSGSQHAFGTPARQGQAGLAQGNKVARKGNRLPRTAKQVTQLLLYWWQYIEKMLARLLLCTRASSCSLPLCLSWLLLVTAQVLSLFSALFLLLCAWTVFDKPAREVLKSQARHPPSALIHKESLKNNSVRLSEASANLILQRCIIQL